MWRESYDSSTFVEDLEKLWEDIRPLYQHLHAYVRMKLRKIYGERIKVDGPIPAHLLGNLILQHLTTMINGQQLNNYSLLQAINLRNGATLFIVFRYIQK